MKIFQLFIIFSLVMFKGYGQLPEFEWAEQCGNPPNSTDIKSSLAPGPEDTFYLSGEFRDTALFGNKSLVAAGGSDVFLVRFASSGDAMWSARIGGSDDDYLQKIKSDPDGNVIIGGFFYGETMIGPDNYSSFGSQDLYLAKFNAAGEFQWSFRAGGEMADYLASLDLDEQGNVIISGHYYGNISFGDTTLTGSQGSDVFVASLDADGNLQWVISAGGTSSDQVSSLACDPDGNIFLAGSFYENITLGDTTLQTIHPVGVFVGKFSPQGQLICAFQLDGTYLTTEVQIAVTASGSFYLSGNFSEQITFGNKVFQAGEFNQDIYLARYDGTCDLTWARHAFSFSSDQVVALETDSYDNVFLTGHFLDTIHFETLTLPYTLCCGSREVFIVSFSAAGRVLWGDQISGTRANVQAVALNQEDELLLSGLFTEEVIIGQHSLSNFDGFRNYITSLRTEVFTRIADPAMAVKTIMYPNPATCLIYPDIPSPDALLYRIFRFSGQVVASGEWMPGSAIDISRLEPGLYFVEFDTAMPRKIGAGSFIKQ